MNGNSFRRAMARYEGVTDYTLDRIPLGTMYDRENRKKYGRENPGNVRDYENKFENFTIVTTGNVRFSNIYKGSVKVNDGSLVEFQYLDTTISNVNKTEDVLYQDVYIPEFKGTVRRIVTMEYKDISHLDGLIVTKE